MLQSSPVSPGTKFYDNLERLNFHYPFYTSPFTVSINANFSKWMDRYCHQWALENSGSMQTNQAYSNGILNSDVGLFSACTFPSANWHRLEKLIKWCTMFFIVDDYQDAYSKSLESNLQDCGHFWQDMLDMLDNIQDPRSTNGQQWPDFIKAIRTVMREIYFDFTPEQIKRSVRMITDYISGNILEKQWSSTVPPNHIDSNNNSDYCARDKLEPLRSSHEDLMPVAGDTDASIPDWNTYMKARLGSVGGQMTLQLVEYAKNIALTDHEWNHPLMVALVKAVSEEMILVNDYLTFRKEIAENDFKFSQMRHAFTILVAQGLSLQEAVQRVHRLILEKDQLIFDLLEQILANNEISSDQRRQQCLKAYVNGVKEVLGGYWRFAITSRRYHGAKFHGAIPPSGHFVYHVDQTMITTVDEAQINHHYPWLRTSIPDNVQPS